MGTNDPTNAEGAGQEGSSQPSLPPQGTPSDPALGLGLGVPPSATPPGYSAPPSQPLPSFGAWPPQPGMAVPPPVYPDAGSYPAYPPYPTYPPPLGYANPPGGYYSYGPPPWGAPGWATAPMPQSTPTSAGKITAWVLGSILITVLVVCGACVGLNGLVAGIARSAITSGPYTATETPTETPGSYFSALVPGPGCGTPGWTTSSQQSSTLLQCGSTSLLMKQLASASSLTEVFWTNPSVNLDYSTWVTIGALSKDTCGGLGFQTGVRLYTEYICTDGAWEIDGYDDSGTPHQQAVGAVNATSSYRVEVTVTDSSFTLSINNTRVITMPYASTYEADYITLVLFSYVEGDGSGTFSNFIYSSL